MTFEVMKIEFMFFFQVKIVGLNDVMFLRTKGLPNFVRNFTDIHQVISGQL